MNKTEYGQYLLQLSNMNEEALKEVAATMELR